MSKFDRKELSPRVYAILEMIESYTEDRHTQGSRFINANTQQKWELLEDILTEQVQEVQAEPVALAYPHEQMDALAISRYKVVPSDQSMYWRHAVVAGDGQQHLYNGSEVDCQNLARKFAGAFLDGAFAFHSLYTAPQAQPADALDAERIDNLYIALEVCAAELFAQCGDQGRAMKYVEQARKTLAAEQCIRAAMAAAQEGGNVAKGAAPVATQGEQLDAKDGESAHQTQDQSND